MALAHLYAEHADALRGKHPFTEEEFAELQAASEWLLDNLTPDGARRPAAKQRGEAEKMRDRLWTLMVRRHADLRKIGYYFHGDAFEDATPKLQSRLASTVADEEEEADQPIDQEEETKEAEEEDGF
ncbi:uncharacterized protein SOCE26_046600 [Sorangium cellulosum]|uniref:Uncharacterized protein n=2 Tax=Sorangium cellulosum TaxID=56 RepID=A0A2L0EV85_SORCE|nr:uncharacterized protein SOCE26_046600 [Sorangium cellulosum]